MIVAIVRFIVIWFIIKIIISISIFLPGNLRPVYTTGQFGCSPGNGSTVCDRNFCIEKGACYSVSVMRFVADQKTMDTFTDYTDRVKFLGILEDDDRYHGEAGSVLGLWIRPL